MVINGKLMLGGLIGVGLVGLYGVGVASADTTDVVDEIGIGVPMSCTLSGTGNNSHTATIPNGIYSGTYSADGVDYTDGIGTTTLTAMCNDNEGFSIYAAGYTGDEIGGTNSTNLVGTTASGNSVIVTGTNTGPVNNTDTSNWAMKLSTITSPTPTYPITIDNGYNSYSAVPSSYTKVAHRDSATDVGPNGVGSTLTTTYAAYISKTQPADTYSGKVIYTLIHPSNAEAPLSPQPATAGCINYFANASTAEGTMGCQSATDGNTITLLASNFSRDGYGFAGWTNKYDYATNPIQNGIEFYGPQESITVPQGTTANGLSLYAIWIKSEGSIQDTTKVSQVCSRLTQSGPNVTKTLDSVSALTDQRDNETYAIAKLADGNCWMIENLRLEAEDTRTPEKQALAQGYGTSTTYGNFSGLADAESANFSNSTTANSIYYSGTQSGDATINIGTSNYPGHRFPRYNRDNTNARATNPAPTSNSSAMYSYGNYYSWSAAIADTAAYTSNNTSVTNTSICPSGWHLPKGGSKSNEANNEFWSLVVTGINNGTNPANYESITQPYYAGTPEGIDASKKLRAYPNNFVYSGVVYGGSVSNRGSFGSFWSSTAYSPNAAYHLSLNSGNVYPGTNVSELKCNGRTVRCVATGA